MIVYRFLSEQWGLAALREKRLKLARLDELNDPFELLGANLKDKNLRRAFQAVKAELSKTVGILCFSKRWHNPVLWSHYADKHRGLCLGFEVPDKLLEAVDYNLERTTPEPRWLQTPEPLKLEHMRKFLRTKFRHWEYEEEVRLFFRLETKDSATGHYFEEFSTNLALAEAIIGPNSKTSPREVLDAIDPTSASGVAIIPSRLAFQSFSVVPNKSKIITKRSLAKPSIS